MIYFRDYYLCRSNGKHRPGFVWVFIIAMITWAVTAYIYETYTDSDMIFMYSLSLVIIITGSICQKHDYGQLFWVSKTDKVFMPNYLEPKYMKNDTYMNAVNEYFDQHMIDGSRIDKAAWNKEFIRLNKIMTSLPEQAKLKPSDHGAELESYKQILEKLNADI